MPKIYVLDVAEFLPIVDAARRRSGWRIDPPAKGYWRVEAPVEIILHRREMGLKPAVWYGLFTGGLNGEITQFDRDELRVISTNKPL